MTQTVVVQVGNSDDKLSQAEWSEYTRRVHEVVRSYAMRVHFAGFSPPAAPWQNACWVVEQDIEQHLPLLRRALARLAAAYRQDSIALTVGDTVLVPAAL